MEFHIARRVRDKYQFDELLFSFHGNVIFTNFYATRLFAQKMNGKRDLTRYPEQAVKAGQINAMGLIDEIFHLVCHLYRKQKQPKVMTRALEFLYHKFGEKQVNHALQQFIDEFPPISVYRGLEHAYDYFNGKTQSADHREIILEEMILLWLANMNPAFSPYLELFNDERLEKRTLYRDIIDAIIDFFTTQPPFGPAEQNLIDMLRSPMVIAPHSLSGQLEYIRSKWGYLLGDILYRLLGSLDVIQEEEKGIFFGKGPSSIPSYDPLGFETENYSLDMDWMIRVVMLAKNVYVWLDQLSKKYQKPLSRLNQIPNKELDLLASWGFTSLWLIGLWERSQASKQIKQLCGNTEAEASAYALDDYQIASDLGGEGAFQDLKKRAWERGIRLAGDMVPNHVGIDGKWVIEHPDWFISLDHKPFPSYQFKGINLSRDPRIGVYLEDHYYDRSDAAVVFKRLDSATGREKYIYHGNDGTSMPWNDTAQLNFLNPDVREAVIQTIIHVSRKFPIIRFDAAMTLAKQHFQRLWFPIPGTGGAIPSRAEHGLPKEQFDQQMVKEFWREVVDRMKNEAPETLLLAEAFWLLEGYFVRTLGMHRVYNSSFMNMLKNEENKEYRDVVKSTLKFDPEILKRFVNFMNNPDEETAAAQFGKGDKYFGICVMLATLPGLPLFGHGQIEGFLEKYGMEFRRTYWNETPDRQFIERHQREIFPLLKKRVLFAESAHFLLYDCCTHEGEVNEDIFAYTNQYGEERVLVVFHNRFAEAHGWIFNSVSTVVKKGKNGKKEFSQSKLGEALGIHYRKNGYCLFRDQITGLQYIRSSQDLLERGLFIQVGSYQYHVFLDFREINDLHDHRYSHLNYFLNGRGVPNLDEAMKMLFLQPLHQSFQKLVNHPHYSDLLKMMTEHEESNSIQQKCNEIEEKIITFFRHLEHKDRKVENVKNRSSIIRLQLAFFLSWPNFISSSIFNKSQKLKKLKKYLQAFQLDNPLYGSIILNWIFTHLMGQVEVTEGFALKSRSMLDDLKLNQIIEDVFHEFGFDEMVCQRNRLLVGLLITHQCWYDMLEPSFLNSPKALLEYLFQDEEVRQYLHINRFQEVLWFNKESLEEMFFMLSLIAIIQICSCSTVSSDQKFKRLVDVFSIVQQILKSAQRSEYRVELLFDKV